MNMETTKDTLKIGKKEYPVKICSLKQADLKFYEENPRVYSSLNSPLGAPSQEEIEEHMKTMEHVKQLKLSIESNGGLIDPLIVRDGDYVVLEGNSRLAAYRLLCEKDPVTWGYVRCKILPADISETAIFNLLGQYHIIGRKDWEPFEQANYLYRRHKETKIPIEAMASELGITKSRAEKMIEVITFMVKNDDLNKKHWSHYEEYLKNAGIKKYRETNGDIDDTIVGQIKEGKIREASDIRKLGDVAKVNDKQSKKIMAEVASGNLDIYEAYSEVKDSGKLDDVVKKLKRFRNDINDESFEKQIMFSIDTSTQAEFEISKIIKRLEKIHKKINDAKNNY